MNRRLQRTAYHEAGHAVASWRLDIRFRHVTIIPNDEEGYWGCVVSHLPKWFQPEAMDDRSEMWAFHRIMMLFAGEEAERLLTGRNSPGAAQDKESAKNLALFVTGEKKPETYDTMPVFGKEFGKEASALLKWLRIRTRTFVRSPRYRIPIEAVAEALLKDKTLTMAQVAEISRAAMTAAMNKDAATRTTGTGE